MTLQFTEEWISYPLPQATDILMQWLPYKCIKYKNRSSLNSTAYWQVAANPLEEKKCMKGSS